MIWKLFILVSLLFISNCGNNIQVDLPSSNHQSIRDLVDKDTTSTNSNRQSSVSSTNSSGAVGGPTVGAVGTNPAVPSTGTTNGNYTGNPNPSGY